MFVSGAPSNFVTVSGSRFATLANTDPNSNCGSCSCQQFTYLSLPAGWIIAPYNCQTAFAASCYGWNTDYVVLSDDSHTRTRSYGTNAFTRAGSGYLLTSSSTYSVSTCYRQILITDNVTAAFAVCPNLPTTCSSK